MHSKYMTLYEWYTVITQLIGVITVCGVFVFLCVSDDFFIRITVIYHILTYPIMT